MIHLKAIIVALLGSLVLATAVTAQTPKPAPLANKPEAKPMATAVPGALAVVNGQTITLADIDPKVRSIIEGLDKQIADTRRNVLEAMINEALFEAEAKKRKVTIEQLRAEEIEKRITAPTEEEIKAVYEANREQIGAADLTTVRPQIIAYLNNQRAQKLRDELAARLRAANPVTMGTDVNAPNLAPSAVLVTVAGRTITAAAFNERLKPIIYELRLQAYEAEKDAVTRKINNLLLEAEAKRRNTTADEIFRTEVTEKMRRPTDADVTKFYEENKARITGELASVRPQIASYLEQQEQQRLENELAGRLRTGANVRLLLTEPEPPVQAISTDDDPSRGNPNAPVTIVEFTDFQCPSCAAMHPILEETLQSYANRVRLVVRDFPLERHLQARKAAEAASAAHAQGKFFEYASLLFKNQAALDIPSLKNYATQLGLDRARFDAALDNGTYAAEISHDLADGQRYGVDATPTIYINGVRLRDLSAEGLRAAIDRALARAGQAPTRTKR